jgi:nitrogen fixation protein NifZ
MSRQTSKSRPATIAPVVQSFRRRLVGPAPSVGGGKREFRLGEAVRSLTPVRNDGVYPHKDIGEIVVHKGDAGIVRESWSFLGEIYYTVEFGARAAVVIMRGREMEKALLR